ncbi:hypothetical protein ACLKA6_001805 [Drosophila palustris]
MSQEQLTSCVDATAAVAAAAATTAEDTSKVEVIVYTKSDKTLKQNMNAKDETLRKRTSLIIVPQQVDDLLENGNGNRNSIASMDSCVSTNTTQSNPSIGGSSSSSSSSSSSEDAHAAYQDLQNGNANGHDDDDDHLTALHSPSCSSSTSESTSCCSSVDYSLREQLQNFANRSESDQLKNDLPTAAQLLKGMSLPMDHQTTTAASAAASASAAAPHCDALLSPQEAPLGRRYAEVAQFKSHGKARASEQQQLPSAAAANAVATSAIATPSTDKTEAAVSTIKSNNNYNINNNNNNHSNKSSNNASQSQKSQANSNNNNNNSNNNSGIINKLNGQTNHCSNNINNYVNNVNNNNNNLAMTATSQVDAKNGDSRRSSSLDPDADDVVDLAHGGAFEDDMQALLPKCTRRSRDELSQSRTSLVSSSEGGILAEGETSSDEESSRDSSDNSPPCDLGLMERLLLTHPMWFLPGIQRSGAVHLLQGKEEGDTARIQDAGVAVLGCAVLC